MVGLCAAHCVVGRTEQHAVAMPTIEDDGCCDGWKERGLPLVMVGLLFSALWVAADVSMSLLSRCRLLLLFLLPWFDSSPRCSSLCLTLPGIAYMRRVAL